MPRIFPEYVPIALPAEVSVLENPPRYGKSPVFDFNTGEFKLGPAGELVTVEGQETLIQWIRKTLVTPRFAYGIYPSWYGSALLGGNRGSIIRESKNSQRIIGNTTGQQSTVGGNMSVIGDIEREIKDALLVDRRIIELHDFTSQVDGDRVITTFTVHSTIGPSHGLQVVTELRNA